MTKINGPIIFAHLCQFCHFCSLPLLFWFNKGFGFFHGSFLAAAPAYSVAAHNALAGKLGTVFHPKNRADNIP